MTSRDFVYWLQGYFEILDCDLPMTAEQVSRIRRHLALVFAHEIDPSFGDAEHQRKLQEIHDKPKKENEVSITADPFPTSPYRRNANPIPAPLTTMRGDPYDPSPLIRC